MAGLFDKQAEMYLEFRPTYPTKWYKMLAQHTTHHSLAWDVGTGNGQAANGVAQHYENVIGTDVSLSQLKFAMANPKVRYLHTPLSISEDDLVSLIGGEDSVDLITVAEAVHWFDLPKFYSVASRLLRKPGGILAVWGYNVEMVVDPTFDAIFNRFYDSVTPFWDSNFHKLDDGYKSLPFPFKSVGLGSEGEPLFLEIPKKISFDGLLGMIRSWSAVNTAKEKGVDLLPESVVHELEEAWGGRKLVRLITYKAFMIAGKVGVFPGFSGEEYLNFTILAEKLRYDYSFGHTLDAKDFQLDSMETFIEEATVPTVTIFNLDESNYEYVNNFFNSLNAKAMLFLNFSQELDSFKHTYNDVAALYKGKGVSFLMGDVEASQRAFQYFGLTEDQAPLIIIQNNDGTKYLKANLAPDEIAPWLKNYKDGNLTLFVKSEPIPIVNEEPVKVVVRDNLQEIVFNSGKNVFLEFYAPWCGHCKQLAPTLDEVAKSFVNDHDVVIAKLDATANDVPKDIFDVQGFPTLYFISASGNLLQYDGGRTKEEIIDFIQKNQDKPAAKDTSKEDLVKSDSTKEDASKDEL